MILSEEDTPQRPKLPMDPSIGPTNRAPPETNVATSSSSPRPPSPNPTLPGYEASQAQQLPTQKRRGWRFWNGRVRKVILYALVVYSSIAFVIGIPTFIMRLKGGHHKFKWEPVDHFEDSGHLPLPPPPPHKQMGLSPQDSSDVSVSCNAWAETMAGMARMHLAFPLVKGIALRSNLSSQELKGYVAGSLTVDVNPEKDVSGVVLTANARYSNLQLFKASSVCLTHFGNATEIMIHIPERAENSSDMIQMDLQLLLPRTSTRTGLDMFVINLPMFKQVLGDLSHVFFEHFKIVDPGTAITVGSISASSLTIRTSNADISGNFSASKKLYLDTINGALFANVSLHNKGPMKTKLSMETGNGPIVAHVKLFDKSVHPPGPKHRNFITKFRTFNASMNVSISHAKQSKPARLAVMAENVLGPMDVSLDSQYTGIFDVRAKAGTVQVLETTVSDAPASSRARIDDDNDGDDDDGDNDEGHELHFVNVSPERIRGWIGDSRRPEEFDRRTLGRVELINSLSPIRLHLDRLQPLTLIRR